MTGLISGGGQYASLHELIAQWRARPELQMFMKRLWEHESHARLFLLHRDILFPRIVDELDISLPILFLDRLPPIGAAREQAGVLLTTTSKLRMEQSKTSLQPIESTFATGKQDIRDLLCLLILRFIKKNKPLQDCLSQEDVLLADVRKALTSQKLSFDIFREVDWLGKLWRDQALPLSGDPALKTILATYTKRIRKTLEQGVFPTIGAMDFASCTAPLYVLGHSIVNGILARAGIDRPTYESLLSELYVSRVITNAGTAFWCAHCHDDPFLVTTSSRLAPSQLLMKCPKCERDTCVGTAYEMSSMLLDAIKWKDGMLGVAIGWLLADKNINYRAGAFAQDYETDFQFTLRDQDYLVECKMHKAGKDRDAVLGQLTNDVASAAKHATTIQDAGRQLGGVWIVVNLAMESIQKEIQGVLSKRSEDVARHHIEVIPPQEFRRRLTGAL